MKAKDATSNLSSQTYLSRHQLALRWGCSLSTVRRMEKSGELVPTRLGPRTHRFSMAQIEAIEKSKTDDS